MHIHILKKKSKILERKTVEEIHIRFSNVEKRNNLHGREKHHVIYFCKA